VSPALWLMVAVMSGSAAVEGRIAALDEHLRRHPEAEAVDLYKFLHQGEFGPGHMIEDRAAAQRYLERELAGLEKEREADSVCEALGGDPAMVRIHLRPFLASGFDTGELLDAFVASANQVSGDPETIAAALDRTAFWLRSQGRDDLAGELEGLGAEFAGTGYPALHHSEAYREAYKPAYRVVLRELAEHHGWCR
jgi:hypothetical protein